MIEMYQATGVEEAAQKAMKSYMDLAFANLDGIKVPASNKEPLKELAEYLMKREI